MFHKRFGEVKISSITIHRIYLKHNIRFKIIKRGKREIDFSEPQYLSLFHRMYALLYKIKECQSLVVYLDNTVCTLSTFRAKGWVNRRNRLKVNNSDLKVQTLALIAANSEYGGLIVFAIRPKGINTDGFVAIVRQLSEKVEVEDFEFFLDN
jgi:hypothetical protein